MPIAARKVITACVVLMVPGILLGQDTIQGVPMIDKPEVVRQQEELQRLEMAEKLAEARERASARDHQSAPVAAEPILPLTLTAQPPLPQVPLRLAGLAPARTGDRVALERGEGDVRLLRAGMRWDTVQIERIDRDRQTITVLAAGIEYTLVLGEPTSLHVPCPEHCQARQHTRERGDE